MATPNLISLTTIAPAVDFMTVSGSATAIVTAGASNAIKVNSLIVSNTTGTAATVTVDVYRSAAANVVVQALSIPPNTVAAVLTKNAPLYLEADDALRLTSGTPSALVATVSYEDMS